MCAGEVVVPATKVEEAPPDKGQHHAQSPWFEQVHPAGVRFVLSLLRLPLDKGLWIEVNNLCACALVDHDAQSSTARKTCVGETRRYSFASMGAGGERPTLTATQG
jgi:hypothetical protein